MSTTLVATPVLTARYYGSLAEYRGTIGCATLEGEWTGPDTTRYTVVLWDDRGTLRHVRRSSLEFGGVAMWGPEMGPCLCRCGLDHDRAPKEAP